MSPALWLLAAAVVFAGALIALRWLPRRATTH